MSTAGSPCAASDFRRVARASRRDPLREERKRRLGRWPGDHCRRSRKRAAYRLIWLDPLSGTRDYSPDARGARALSGHADDHLAANTLDGLARIAELLGKVGRGRPVRRAEAA